MKRITLAQTDMVSAGMRRFCRMADRLGSVQEMASFKTVVSMKQHIRGMRTKALVNREENGVEQKMEKTPCRRAFLSMFYLLDSIYSRFPYNNLGVVLSDICPFTFKDSMSADPAAWDDFCEYYKEAEGTYSGEIEVGYYTALCFLRVYEEEWDFPIPYAMEEFTNEKYREYYYKEDV